MDNNVDASTEGTPHRHKAGSPSGKTERLTTTLPTSQLEKLKRIRQACDDQDRLALKELATSEAGLIQDDARRIAWPILLGSTSHNPVQKGGWRKLDRHRDEDQVGLDVNRAFVYYPENESTKKTEIRKNELSDVIIAVLRTHPMLSYFQGFHDIAQVLLLVLGAEAAEAAVAHLSLLRIRDFMLPTLAGAESHLHLLPSILYAVDTELYKHLSGAARPAPFFALAATLTWYAHDIEKYGDIARLFDFLLANEAAIPVYLFATIVISRKAELLEIEQEDSDMLHFTLSKLPEPLDLDSLIGRTVVLFDKYPPEHLPGRAWSRISNASVLKTTRNTDALSKQTLKDGERMFDQQAKQIERQEMRKRLNRRLQALMKQYRKPVRWTGAAMLVAVLAFYVGRSDNATPALQGTISTLLLLGRYTYDTIQRYSFGIL